MNRFINLGKNSYIAIRHISRIKIIERHGPCEVYLYLNRFTSPGEKHNLEDNVREYNIYPDYEVMNFDSIKDANVFLDEFVFKK